MKDLLKKVGHYAWIGLKASAKYILPYAFTKLAEILKDAASRIGKDQ